MSDNAAVDRLNALVSKLVAAIRPPPNVTVSEWAAQNRVLSPEASAEQGRWRNSRTPYLVEIMDAYSDPRVHHIVVVASSQVGKSEFENNVIGRTIDVDPGSILFIHPVQTDAKEYSKLRIAPMIRDCPTLRAKVAESKSRDSGNTILQKSYPGGILTMCGSTEAHALASKPINVTVSEWAAQNRVLSPEASAEQGRWRNSRTPYLVEIMDAYSDPRVHHIVVVASSQVGKSEFENNVIGRTIDVDPGSILFIHPVQTDAKEYSKLRIAPMIRDCPTLRAKVAESKSRDSGNTILQKSYPGGILTMCGSTEAHALASKPIRYVLGDERDRWAASAGTEGDPWELAMARQTTFYNSKAVEVSTPTIKGHSAIAKSYVKGTMERWVSQCPHCKGFHELRWEDIRYDYDTIETHGEKTYKVKDVWYLCPECGCISDEVTMKRAPAHWQAENPAAYENGIRSFWLNSFVSQWAAWKDTVLKYLNALGDTKKMQVVYNTRLGLLWEDRGDVQDEDTMLGRREEYPAELPEGVLVLTAGVDTQDDRMEYEIVGFGHFGETWGIEKGIVSGRPDSDEVWQQLDELVFDRKLKFADGVELPVSIKFVDEGGHFTQEIRQRCHDRIGKKVFCIKGFPGSDRPFTSPPKQQKITVQNRYIGMCWQYQLGVDSGKQIIMDDLKVQEPGARYCHFPRRDDYGLGYFNGLLSEHLVYKDGHRNPWQWEKISGHERNEPLDCRNYALAAFKVLPKDLDAIDRRLKQLRGKAVDTPAAVNIQQPISRSQPTGRKREKLLDDW